MKVRSYILVLLVIFVCACNRERPDEAVKSQLAIIKISPEMKEQVFVTPIVNSIEVDYTNPIPNLTILHYGDGLVLCNPTGEDSVRADFAQTCLKITGTNPYILLDNGYAVINWKWGDYHPLSGEWRRPINITSQLIYSTNPYYENGSLANEEYYLLSIPWDEVTQLRTIWPMEAGRRIEKPEVRYIDVQKLQEYGHLKTSNININSLLDAYWAYKRDSINFQTFVEQRDNELSTYVETLNKMISNNDFEKWTRIQK